MTDTDAITTLAVLSLWLMVSMGVCALAAAVGVMDRVSEWIERDER